MEPLMQPGDTLRLGALACALLWGLSAAYTSRGVSHAPTPTAHTPAMHAECRGGKPIARSELFFGLSRPDGSTVSAEEFQRFVEQEITPRFPAGATLLGGDGQFRGADGITIRESAKVLILLYPYDSDHTRKIEAIREAYVKAFAQESVLRVDGSSCLS